MKKFLFTMVLLFSTLMSISAQTAIETQKTIVDNTYIGITAGAYTPLQLTEVFPLNATVSVRVGKEFNPVVGMELEGTAAFGSHTAHAQRYSMHNAVRATNVGLNGVINLTNAILGYDKPRNFELKTITGFGWGHGFVNQSYGKDINSLTAKTGIEANFRVNDGLSFILQPNIIWALTNTGHTGVKFNSNHAQLGVLAGLVYHFKTSNGTHNFKVYDVGALNDEINKLREQNNELRNQPAKLVEISKEVIKEVPVETLVNVGDVVITFAQGKSELSESARYALNNITAKTVKIVATASPEGTKEFNQKISEERAQVVKEYLESHGVTVASAQGLGVQGNESNRIAIVSIVE